MNISARILLQLLRAALGGEFSFFSYTADWKEVMALSMQHGVSSIVVDGLNKFYDLSISVLSPEMDSSHKELSISSDLMYKWLGLSLSTEKDYLACRRAIIDLAKFYDGQGIKLMLLKGYGLSLNYPIPSHRPVGDIDIYNFGLWQFADQMVEQRLGLRVDKSHHHHTIYSYNGFLVENHYDFVNVKAHASSSVVEAKLKELAKDAIEKEIDGVKIYLPSADFNAIFLIRHAGAHFSGDKMNLRQLLDWALFIDKHSNEVDWNMVLPFIKKIGCWSFFCAVNGICVTQLGIPIEKFPEFDRNYRLEERVIGDILQPEFSGKGSGVVFKFRRWCSNIWKHRMVYDEKLLPMFIRLAWSHIRKPIIIE